MNICLVILTGVFLNASMLYADNEVRIKLKPGNADRKQMDINDDRIICDFPEPTDIRDIAQAFSLWTGKKYEVDEHVKAKVRLHSPEPVSKSEGLKRFKRMLAQYHLKSTDVNGINKIEASE